MTAPWSSDFTERVVKFFADNPSTSYAIAASTLGVSRSALICGCKRRGLDVLAGKDSSPTVKSPKSRGPDRVSRKRIEPRPAVRWAPSKPAQPPAPDLAAIAREALADGVKITRLPEGYARGAFQARYPSLVGSML